MHGPVLCLSVFLMHFSFHTSVTLPTLSQTLAFLTLSVSRLSGCYQSLEGGNTGDAVVDFSGAVSEAISLEEGQYFKDQKKQDKLFEDLLKVYDRGGIISCSIKVGALSEHIRLCVYTADTQAIALYGNCSQNIIGRSS